MQPTKTAKSFKKHPLIHFLIKSKGNPKALILQEPLWGIPFHLIAPFAALYMSVQGISDTQIGIILSVTMVSQVVFGFFSGIITDKLGRKAATMIGDFFGFGIACLMWAISNNFWLFLIAVLFNGAERIAFNSWQCLLIEDAPQKDLLNIFTWTTIGGLVAVFFAPVSGFLIFRFDLIPVVRGLYVLFAVCMFSKCIITYFFCSETKQGKIRKKETRSIPVRTMVLEYTRIIPQILKSPATMKIVVINVILHITVLITTTYFGLYVTAKLGVAEQFLAIFPIINAVIMLLFMFVIQHRIEFIKNKIPMWAGLIIFTFGSVMLILIPSGNLLLIVVYLFLVAVANALVLPRRDAMLQIALDPEERARIMGLILTITIALSAPFGVLAGVLSDIDRRLPFLLTTILFLIAIVIVGMMKEDEYKAKARKTIQ